MKSRMASPATMRTTLKPGFIRSTILQTSCSSARPRLKGRKLLMESAGTFKCLLNNRVFLPSYPKSHLSAKQLEKRHVYNTARVSSSVLSMPNLGRANSKINMKQAEPEKIPIKRQNSTVRRIITQVERNNDQFIIGNKRYHRVENRIREDDSPNPGRETANMYRDKLIRERNQRQAEMEKREEEKRKQEEKHRKAMEETKKSKGTNKMFLNLAGKRKRK